MFYYYDGYCHTFLQEMCKCIGAFIKLALLVDVTLCLPVIGTCCICCYVYFLHKNFPPLYSVVAYL